MKISNNIGAVYPTEFPVKQRCADGMYTTNEGPRACSWHGGVVSSSSSADFDFSEDIDLSLDLALETDIDYIVLSWMRGVRFNTANLVAYTGLRKSDISQMWYSDKSKTTVEGLAEDIVEEATTWRSDIDENEIVDVISRLVQRTYKVNMRMIADRYKNATAIFGTPKNKVATLAAVAIGLYLISKI